MLNSKLLKKYKNHEAPEFSKRIMAFLIDTIIYVIVSFVLLLIGSQIIGGTSWYNNEYRQMQDGMVACYRLNEESRIYFFDKEHEDDYSKPIDQEILFEKYCYSYILSSFEKHQDIFIANNIDGVVVPDGVLAASYNEDSLAYFIVTFLSSHPDIYDLNGQIPEQKYYEVLKQYSNNIELWELDETNYTLPVLNANKAIDLYKYLKDNSYKAGLTVFNYLATSYQAIWNFEVDLLVNSPVYKGHYDYYYDAYRNLAIGYDINIIICAVIGFVICNLLPSLLFKNGVTLGKKAQKIMVCDNEYYEMQTGSKIIYSITSFFLHFGALIIPCYLAGGLNAGWMFPIIRFNNYGISLMTIMVLFTIVNVVDLFIAILRKDKRSIRHLLSKTRPIDNSDYMQDEPVDGETTNDVSDDQNI